MRKKTFVWGFFISQFFSSLLLGEGNRSRWGSTRYWMVGIAVCGLLLARAGNENTQIETGRNAIEKYSFPWYQLPRFTPEEIRTKESFLAAMKVFVRAQRLAAEGRSPDPYPWLDGDLTLLVRNLVIRYPDLASQYGFDRDFTPSRDLKQTSVPYNTLGDWFWRVADLSIRQSEGNLDDFILEAMGRYYEDNPEMSHPVERLRNGLRALMLIYPTLPPRTYEDAPEDFR